MISSPLIVTDTLAGLLLLGLRTKLKVGFGDIHSKTVPVNPVGHSIQVFSKFIPDYCRIFMNEFTTPEYGLWEQARVEHEKEFYLALYIHEQLCLSGWGEK